MNPIFDVSVISTQMSLIANFVVKEKQVQFLYHSCFDACHVLVDNEHIGYFKGDNYFRYPNHTEICRVQMPSKSIYSFEKEFIPVYVATVTEFLLTGYHNET